MEKLEQILCCKDEEMKRIMKRVYSSSLIKDVLLILSELKSQKYKRLIFHSLSLLKQLIPNIPLVQKNIIPEYYLVFRTACDAAYRFN